MNLPLPFSLRDRWQQWSLLLLVLLNAAAAGAQTEIPLYPAGPPDGVAGMPREGETANTPIRARIAYNVSRPTLTRYRPDTANGTSVLLIPGGGFYVVNMEHEGEKVAKELVRKGVTVFVLKYRTARTESADPWGEMMANMKDTAGNRKKLEGVRPLAIADAFAALRAVRVQAKSAGLRTDRVGVVGFSAGGALALQLCKTGESDARPDFAGLIYTVYRPAPGDTLPPTVPPVFLAAASDDVLAPSSNSVALYTAWMKTGRPAELHVFAKGGHGLRGGAPARDWWLRLVEWMGDR